MITNTDENSRIDDGATKFLKAMKKYFVEKENLSHSCTTTLVRTFILLSSLLPITYKERMSLYFLCHFQNDQQVIQPSLLACLLGVPQLQKPLLEVILPALSEASFSNA